MGSMKEIAIELEGSSNLIKWMQWRIEKLEELLKKNRELITFIFKNDLTKNYVVCSKCVNFGNEREPSCDINEGCLKIGDHALWDGFE